MLDDNDLEAIQELLEEHLPPTLPCPAEAFVLGHDDWSEDLEQGTVYVRFDEDDLYTKVETPKCKPSIRPLGRNPSSANGRFGADTKWASVSPKPTAAMETHA